MTTWITGSNSFTGSIPGPSFGQVPASSAEMNIALQGLMNRSEYNHQAIVANTTNVSDLITSASLLSSSLATVSGTVVTNYSTMETLFMRQQASNWPVRPAITNSASSAGDVPMGYNYDQEKIVASTADTHTFTTSDGYEWSDNGSYGGDLGSAASAVAYIYSGSTFTPLTLLFASGSGNVLKSTTSFVSWDSTPLSSTAPTAAVVATNPEAVIGVDIRIIAAGASNVFKTSDGGDVWSTVTGWFGGWTGSTKRAHFFRSQNSAFKCFLFLAEGTHNAILHKTANGAGAAEPPVPSKSWVGIASSFLQKQIMVVASDGTCYVSTDPETASPPTFHSTTTINVPVYDLACDGDRLWVALTTSGVVYSTDFGDSWKHVFIGHFTVGYRRLYYFQGKFFIARSNGTTLEIPASAFRSPPLGNWNPNGI